jgi:hypothetical protein
MISPQAAQPGKRARQGPSPVGVGEAGDPIRRGPEEHPVAVPGGDDPERGREMCLSGSGRAEEHEVLRSKEGPLEARVAICWRTAGCGSQSKSSSVFRAGYPASLIRGSAPEALRASLRVRGRQRVNPRTTSQHRAPDPPSYPAASVARGA